MDQLDMTETLFRRDRRERSSAPSGRGETLPVPSEPLTIGGQVIPSRFFLAPLAGYTNLALRRTVRELGGLGLATTDLVNARALLQGSPRTKELIATAPDDRPLAVQIYGSEPG